MRSRFDGEQGRHGDRRPCGGARTFFDLLSSPSTSRRLSGTPTTPMLGSIVQNGKFAACACDSSISALKSVDLPTLGRPTMPVFSAIVLTCTRPAARATMEPPPTMYAEARESIATSRTRRGLCMQAVGRARSRGSEKSENEGAEASGPNESTVH